MCYDSNDQKGVTTLTRVQSEIFDKSQKMRQHSVDNKGGVAGLKLKRLLESAIADIRSMLGIQLATCQNVEVRVRS